MEYVIIYSKRKTISLSIRDDGTPQVRAPRYATKKQIDDFVLRHTDWIEKHRARVQSKAELYSSREITRDEALAKVMPYVEKYSAIMGLTPNEIKITSAKKRFGSCSGRGTVCFSKYLCLYPDTAIEYVVVHELAHLKHLDHSKSFHALVEKHLPDWRERKKLLKNPVLP